MDFTSQIRRETFTSRAISPRKQETQQKILAAAQSLFIECGYTQTSIRTIAAAADVSPSTVFWHFGDKASLFNEVLRDLLRPFVDEISETIDRLPPVERLLELFAIYERFVQKNEEPIEVLVRWLLESSEIRSQLRQHLMGLHGLYASRIRETLSELIDDPAETEAIGAALIGLMDGNLLLAYVDPDARGREVRAQGLRHLARLALAPRA